MYRFTAQGRSPLTAAYISYEVLDFAMILRAFLFFMSWTLVLAPQETMACRPESKLTRAGRFFRRAAPCDCRAQPHDGVSDLGTALPGPRTVQERRRPPRGHRKEADTGRCYCLDRQCQNPRCSVRPNALRPGAGPFHHGRRQPKARVSLETRSGRGCAWTRVSRRMNRPVTLEDEGVRPHGAPARQRAPGGTPPSNPETPTVKSYVQKGQLLLAPAWRHRP